MLGAILTFITHSSGTSSLFDLGFYRLVRDTEVFTDDYTALLGATLEIQRLEENWHCRLALDTRTHATARVHSLPPFAGFFPQLCIPIKYYVAYQAMGQGETSLILLVPTILEFTDTLLLTQQRESEHLGTFKMFSQEKTTAMENASLFMTSSP